MGIKCQRRRLRSEKRRIASLGRCRGWMSRAGAGIRRGGTGTAQRSVPITFANRIERFPESFWERLRSTASASWKAGNRDSKWAAGCPPCHVTCRSIKTELPVRSVKYQFHTWHFEDRWCPLPRGFLVTWPRKKSSPFRDSGHVWLYKIEFFFVRKSYLHIRTINFELGCCVKSRTR